MPKLIKGLEKSMTSSRTRVMVRGATAISALWKQGHVQRALVVTCTDTGRLKCVCVCEWLQLEKEKKVSVTYSRIPCWYNQKKNHLSMISDGSKSASGPGRPHKGAENISIMQLQDGFFFFMEKCFTYYTIESSGVNIQLKLLWMPPGADPRVIH